ncbi:MAG: fumarylacetoacetate hydrolase family protein [Gaiellaceae bacterium MAG52_C11]|nr:fumarylacetoacetate hydrolase family protein [Candidatus Gaiellasilicea maunaloa]
MRLATISTDAGTTAAILNDGAAARIEGYEDVGALLRAGPPGEEAARKTAASGPFDPLDPSRLRRPVLEPGAVVCVGLNYRPHVLEMGRPLPDHPTYFAKLPRALADPFEPIELPGRSERVDYEGEVVVVVGRGGRDVPEEEAWAAVAGLTLMNDVSMRDFQYRTLQWFAGKSWQRSTPVGPAVVTIDELAPLDERELRVEVNGDLRQHASLGDLIFSVAALVADLSRIIELRPGDLIATGTPGGVGDGMEPPCYLADGDVVTVALDGLGRLESSFVAARC